MNYMYTKWSIHLRYYVWTWTLSLKSSSFILAVVNLRVMTLNNLNKSRLVSSSSHSPDSALVTPSHRICRSMWIVPTCLLCRTPFPRMPVWPPGLSQHCVWPQWWSVSVSPQCGRKELWQMCARHLPVWSQWLQRWVFQLITQCCAYFHISPTWNRFLG